MSTCYAQVKGLTFASHHTWRIWGWLRACWGSNLQHFDVSYPNASEKTTEFFGSENVDFFTCHIHVDGLHVKFLNVYVFVQNVVRCALMSHRSWDDTHKSEV